MTRFAKGPRTAGLVAARGDGTSGRKTAFVEGLTHVCD